jgi:hypothetical protein
MGNPPFSKISLFSQATYPFKDQSIFMGNSSFSEMVYFHGRHAY